jgi:hypothetical protein
MCAYPERDSFELVDGMQTTDECGDPAGRRPRLAIAYDIASTSPLALAGLLSDVCDLIWVIDTSDPELGSMGRLVGRLGTVVDTQQRTLPDIVDAVRAERPNGVIAFSDSQVLLAAFLAEALGLVGNPAPVIERLIDKHVQRSALAEAGVAVPAFRRVAPNAPVRAAMAQVADLAFPAVVKPLRGDSSRDVVSVADPADLERTLMGLTHRDGTRAGLVVEEYLPDGDGSARPGLGGYVSVEAVVRDGIPVPLAVTGKFPLVEPFREAGNFMPHPLSVDEVAGVLELSQAAALALEVETGALHIEIKLTPAGPRVIEVNGRLGGGAIDAIYLKRHGRSLTELAARVAMGQPVELTAETPAEWLGPFTYEFFAQPPTKAARLAGVANGESIVGTAGAETVAVNLLPGDELDWRAGSQGYVLRVGGVAPDRAALAAVPIELVEAAGIDYEYA